jgi:hypothetical protein
MFDGGYRIFSGQKPFTDFYFPHGLLCYYLQSIAFYLFGVSYRSFILTGAIANVIVGIFGFRLVRRLQAGIGYEANKCGLPLLEEYLPYLISLVLSVFIFPPFTGLYPELLATLFLIIAVERIIRLRDDDANHLNHIVSGIVIGISFFIKQNIFLFAFLLCFFILSAQVGLNRLQWKKLIIFVLWCSGTVIFGLTLAVVYFDSFYFTTYYLSLPMTEGLNRFWAIFQDRLTLIIIFLMAFIVVVSGLWFVYGAIIKDVLIVNLRLARRNPELSYLIVLITLFATYSQLLLLFIKNSPILSYNLLGLLLGLFIIFISLVSSPKYLNVSKIRRYIISYLLLFAVMGVFCFGWTWQQTRVIRCKIARKRRRRGRGCFTIWRR